MLLTFLKNLWPKLTFNARAPVSRASYLTAEDGTPLTAETGEVIVAE